MLKIRLKRVGRRNDPSFRVVVVDSHQGPKSSKAVETVGSYNPKTKERIIKADRVKHWIGVGAQVSDTVHNILLDEKIIKGKKKNVLPQKSPVVKEEAEGQTSEDKVEEAPSESGEAAEDKPESKDEAPAAEEAPKVPEEKKEETAPEAETEKTSGEDSTASPDGGEPEKDTGKPEEKQG